MNAVSCAGDASRQRLSVGVLVVASLLVTLSGCATSKTAEDPSASAQPADATVRTHENLNGVVWMQTSAEYDALARQAYNVARAQLDRALGDSGWTAALEQTDGYRDKPPAVILDVDETVLDNSPYQARLIEDGESYSPDSWNAWCRKAKAPAVPGALEFTQYAHDQGVTVFYLTNREHKVEEATRKNLRELGFPLADDRDVILTKYERDDWDGRKVPRRELVAEEFRITLLVGDNLGDFVADPEVGPAARTQKVDEYGERLGKRWIVLPNPAYGHWEGAVLDYEWGDSRSEKLKKKRESLTTPEDL